MITFQFRGLVDSIGEFKEGTSKAGKDWRRVDFVCEVKEGRYSDYIAVSASNELADIIGECELGEEIAVKGFIYAREYNGRYYNNLEASEVHRHKAAIPATAAAPAPAPAPRPRPAAPAQEGEDDLPF